jgi:hypothetical protein
MRSYFVPASAVALIMSGILCARSDDIPTLDVRPVCRGIASQSELEAGLQQTTFEQCVQSEGWGKRPTCGYFGPATILNLYRIAHPESTIRPRHCSGPFCIRSTRHGDTLRRSFITSDRCTHNVRRTARERRRGDRYAQVSF